MVPPRDLTNSLRTGAAYLRRVQPRDGGFPGRASAYPSDFSHARTHTTTFFTSLILTALDEVPGTSELRSRAARWLLRQRSSTWSWNYWTKGSRAAQERPYPDDLDDTVCALAGLWRYDHSLIDGTVLAHLAQQLVATEVAAGGPYTTWLVGRAAPAVWRDVDIAVNANIGFFLSLQGVRLAPLERYVDAAIDNAQLTSPYYVGTLPVLYFLARWYRGSQLPVLRDMVDARLKSSEAGESALHQALLITAALHLELGEAAVAAAARRLVAAQSAGSWPAAALYVEPPVKGVAHYAGSPALTTALCLEALALYRRAGRSRTRALPTAEADRTPGVIIDQVLSGCEAIQQPDLKRLYRARVQRLAAGDRDHQITGMATTAALVCRVAVDSEALLHLNVASVQGWTAYTIYDDFLDEEGEPALLSVAHLAARQMVASFQAALPDQPAFQRLVDRTLECVDGANTWEMIHARAPVRRGVVRLTNLPDYGDYAQLAQRSWGHMLAACGVLAAAGYRVDGMEAQQLQSFFHHFLIARQLNDDAHDWEDDLTHGRITAVVGLLLKENGLPWQLKPSRDMKRLRQRFWDQTIVKVAGRIRSEAGLARAALAGCAAVHDGAALERWLDALEAASGQALAQRREAKKFLRQYEASETGDTSTI